MASFADYCRSREALDIRFLAEGPREVAQYLTRRGNDVVHLPDGLTLDEEADALLSCGPADIAIVEMLEITPARQALLRRNVERLIVFDDLCDHVYDADLVVCGQSLPSHANVALSAPGTRFLTGPEYFLCRPEFLPYADASRTYSAEIERILVTLGGGAYDVGYLKAALAIADVLSRVQATFIVGQASPGLADQLRAILPNAEVRKSVDDLEVRLWETDVAITSAGYTKLEAAVTQTPFAMMSAQWHQIPLAAEFARATGATDLGYLAYVTPDDIARALQALAPVDARRAAAGKARGAVDGRGFERVHEAVFSGRPVTGGARA